MEGTTTLAPLNILIVDDEANIRRTLSMSLEAEGHKIVAVSNAQDAVAVPGRAALTLSRKISDLTENLKVQRSVISRVRKPAFPLFNRSG